MKKKLSPILIPLPYCMEKKRMSLLFQYGMENKCNNNF